MVETYDHRITFTNRKKFKRMQLNAEILLKIFDSEAYLVRKCLQLRSAPDIFHRKKAQFFSSAV